MPKRAGGAAMVTKDLAQRAESKALASTDAESILALIKDPSIDADKAERLVALYERQKAQWAKEQYIAAMSRVKAGMTDVPKRGRNPQTGSRYPLLEDVEKMVDPLAIAEGLNLTWTTAPNVQEGWITLVCNVNHAAGHTERFELPGPIDTHGIKGTPVKTALHGTGSALTYLKRRLKCLIFDVTFQDDDDGNAAGVGPEWNPISKAQALNIIAKLEESKGDEKKFCKMYGIAAVEELPKAQYEAALFLLEQKARR